MNEKISCRGNTIITATGLYFDYADPNEDQIEMRDIATALANTCRFGGHCRFYSVAEHCIHCARIAWERDRLAYDLQFHALLHDAAEAYIGDMPKPLKIMMPEFQQLERKIESVVMGKFRIDDYHKDEVKHIDLCMLKAEKECLFANDFNMWSGLDELPVVDVDIKCWEPDEARRRFVNAYVELQEKLNRT